MNWRVGRLWSTEELSKYLKVRVGVSNLAHCHLVTKVRLSGGGFWKQQKASEQNAASGSSGQQPSTLVDLFVSVEKIMVLNTDLQV